MGWDFQTFLDAVQWVAEHRYGSALRGARRKEDQTLARSRAALR